MKGYSIEPVVYTDQFGVIAILVADGLVIGTEVGQRYPITANGVAIGTLLETDRGYRVRRGGQSDGGIPHGIPWLAPNRHFIEDAIDDIVRWLHNPLSEAGLWKEDLSS